MTGNKYVPGSFRDPSGFLFLRDGLLYRQVNLAYRDHYDLLMSSGLYDRLVQGQLLIPHEEVQLPPADAEKAYRLIQPEPVSFISYPFEWCFSQLKDAARVTLRIQQIALDFGMSLKDSSAYNIQFVNGKPKLIDTLSFEKYIEGQPWIAYRQFCQHFLAPLALMGYTDVRLNSLLRNYIDGIPLDLASSLLPGRSKFSFSLLSHLHLHAKSQKRYAKRTVKPTGRKMSLMALRGLIDNLNSAVGKLKWEPSGTEWSDYYEDTNYSSAALEHKKQLTAEFLAECNPHNVWDLGGNLGLFSRIAADQGIPTICFDIDPAAVEKNYRQCTIESRTNLLPLLLDLTNPSPGIGWENNERMSITERGPADAVMALALVHHLAISNNVPLEKIARYFSRLGRWLILEFVPKHDSQVQRLLATREDIFTEYTREVLEGACQRFFSIVRSSQVNDSERIMYLMRNKQVSG